MSHLNEIEMQSQDVDAVVAALIKCGFTKDRITVHKTTQNIIITLQQVTTMSKKVKLSPSARELYDAMKAGVKIFYMNKVPAYYFRGDNFQKVTRAASALLNAGLIRAESSDRMGNHACVYEVCSDKGGKT